MFSSTETGRRAGVIAMAALACAAIAAPASAQAAPAPPHSDSGNVSAVPQLSREALSAGKARYGANATRAQALSAYWTAERMRAAIPAERDPALQEAAERHAQRTQADDAGKPEADDPRFSVRPAAPRGAAAGATATTSAYNPNLHSWHPTARTNGKVFFTKGGGNYVCSAAVINSEGKDTVWTAGHCVHGGRGSTWVSNWTFVPAYDDDLANPRPYGTWSAAYLNSRTAWTSNSDFSEDMGVAVMNTYGGVHIVDRFGGHGFRTGAGTSAYEYAFGYPAESPFDGGNLMRCQGSASRENWWSDQTIKIPCNMTRGSSGGPWLNGYDGNYGYLNGLNSRIDRIVNPTVMMSPYFDGDARSLYDYTRHA